MTPNSPADNDNALVSNRISRSNTKTPLQTTEQAIKSLNFAKSLIRFSLVPD